MIRRCYSKKSHNYKYYGARGIKVCDRWSTRGGVGYRNFVTDMGEPPEGLTLGRIKNELDYSPENCKWQTWKEQCVDKRKSGPPPNPNSLRSKAKVAGLAYMVVYLRIRSGWSEERALTTPKIEKFSKIALVRNRAT